MKILSAPINICFGITHQCNLNCKHCLTAGSRDNKDLTTDELIKIVRQIHKLKVFGVNIFGGEPLMRPDFFTIIEELSKQRLRLTLITNASLITKDIARKLAEYPTLKCLVSLDGSCAKVQDLLRGKGSFTKTIAGIENLIEKKCKVYTGTTVTHLNYRDIENIVLLSKNMGVHKALLNSLAYVGNAACYHQSLVMSPREKFELLNKIGDLRNRFGDFIIGPFVKISRLMDENRLKAKEAFPLQIYSCNAATLVCAIRPDGWVTPCARLWYVKAGNLKEKTLYDIWHNSKVMKAFRQTIEIKEEEIPECKSCEYIRLCYKEGGRCDPYYLPGERFERKELYCWREDVVGEMAFEIKQEVPI